MRKNNKRALIVSALSLLLCVSMLVGSTMAWFTDNASVSVNKVQAGILDIDIVDKDGKSIVGRELNFVDKDNKITWEPGVRNLLESVKVVNNGNLWAKCKVTLNYTDDDTTDGVDLGDVIDVYIAGSTESAGTLSELSQNPIGNEFNLAPKGEEGASATYGEIKLVMQTTAGNEYQGKSISGVSITVQATQATVEKDSYDETYDANAEYDKLVAAANQTDLNDAITNATAGETAVVVLPKGDFTLPKMTDKEVTISGTKDTVIDLTKAVTASGSTVTMEGVTVTVKDTGLYQGIQHADKVVYNNVTFNGTQFLYSDAEFTNCTFNVTGDQYNIWVYGNDATFTNCTFNCDGKAVLQYNEGTLTAAVTFNGCTFNDNGDISGKAAIEIGESANGAKATYTVNVNNCTVNGFDTTTQNANTFGGNNLGTNVWGNKNLMPADRLHVFINGTEVY